MVISLFSVRDISCHAYHALTLCDVARRARLSILSFIHFVKNYPVNIVISTSRLLTCANRTAAHRFWFRQSARHFALNGLFDVFRTSKREKITFPRPSPPCSVVPLFELPLENKKHPNFEWRGQGRGVDSYVSEVTLFEYNVSTIWSPIVGSSY